MIKKIASYVIVLAIGAGIGTYFNQKHTIEEKTVYKDRVKTVVKEIIKENPDGSKVTERVIHTDEKSKQTAQKKESKPVKKDWLVGIGYNIIGPDQFYNGRLERRILGDVYVGLNGDSRGNFGVGITLLF